MSKRYGYLIDQITDYGNMSEAFDEVVGGLRNKERKAYYEAKRSRVIADLQALIVAGRFRVESYTEFEVKEGPKIRKVQSPSVKDRIGCNAIMRVVEKYVYPKVIRTSAASIKGRGMHRLYRKVRTDIRHDKEGTRYYYKCDIRKFYQSIDQKVMWGVVLEYIKDPILLPMLKNLVEMMPEVPTENGLRTVVSFEYDNGDTGKYFTADKQQLWYLEKIREMDEFPFDTTIGSEVFGNGKVRYLFT